MTTAISGLLPSDGLALSPAAGNDAIATMAAPNDIETPLWNLMSVDERRAALADGAEGAESAQIQRVAGGARPAAEPEPAPEVCKVEVRFTPVAGGLANHAFVTTTDRDSVNFFRGGPFLGGPGSSTSGEAGDVSGQLGSASGGSSAGASGSGSSGSSNSGNASSPGSGRGGTAKSAGPWGPIVTKHGAYGPGTIDWTASPTATKTVAVRPGSCDATERNLTRHLGEIDDVQIPYNPLSTNSNATAHTILERSGIHAGVKTPVWAPGWNTRLP